MAEVTRKHRELAFVALYGKAMLEVSASGKDWVETGSDRHNQPWVMVAQALADIEAEALATRAGGGEAEREHLEQGCAEAFVHLQWRERQGAGLAVHQVEWLRAHERYMVARNVQPDTHLEPSTPAASKETKP